MSQIEKMEFEISKWRFNDLVTSPEKCVVIENFDGCYGVKVSLTEYKERNHSDRVLTKGNKSISQLVFDDLRENGEVVIPFELCEQAIEDDSVDEIGEEIQNGVENYIRHDETDIHATHNREVLNKIGYANVIQPDNL